MKIQKWSSSFVYQKLKLDDRQTHDLAFQQLSILSNKDTLTITKDSFSILIGGHLFGNHNDTNLGIYPKFLKHLSNEQRVYDQAILLGDIVKEQSITNLKLALNQMEPFAENIAIAPGNHDVGQDFNNAKRDVFVSLCQPFQSFFIQNHLFLILDISSSIWEIDELQLSWLKKELDKNKNIASLIICTHQIIWNDFVSQKVSPNSVTTPKSMVFQEFLDLILEKKPHVPIRFIAGDTGAYLRNNNLFCEPKGQFGFIATGMGGGETDNYLVLEITKNKLEVKPYFF